MPAKKRFMIVVCLVVVCSAIAPALAEEGAKDKARAAKSPEKDQFWFIGTTNYHIKLEESEAKVDGQLDNTLGLILPRWDRPTTFKDWSEDWRIWDLWIGYGRDISARSSWTVYTGGGAGTVENGDRYFPLGLPMKLKADFYRRSILAGSSISYYPFDRPVKKGEGFLESLKSTKPVTEMNIGYTRQTAIGDVTLELPLLGNVLHIKDEEHYNLFWLSPRLGIETMIDDDDSINILGGYLFFHDHAKEFNGGLFEIFWRHRF